MPSQLEVCVLLAFTLPLAGVGPVFGVAGTELDAGFGATEVRRLRLLFAPYDPVIGMTQSKQMPVNKRTAPNVARAVIEAEEVFMGEFFKAEYRIFLAGGEDNKLR